MKLKKLDVLGLYGGIDASISFNDKVSLLVGINGSGKTSVLNLIDWLLSANYEKLAITEYKLVSLAFEFDKKYYKIICTKNNDTHTCVDVIADGVEFPTLSIPILNADLEDLPGLYRAMKPEEHEIKAFEFLKGISKPLIISLDRTISLEIDDKFYFDSSKGVARKASSKSPLSHVKKVASEKFSEYRAIFLRNDDELKSKIIMSAFNGLEEALNNPPKKKMTEAEIKKLQRKVVDYLSGVIKVDGISRKVSDFFDTSRHLANSKAFSNKNLSIFSFIYSKYSQISDLADAFNAFDTKNSESFKHIELYLMAVNKFLKDSNKNLFFDEGSGELSFCFLNSSIRRSIDFLSSGEKQILILFTFIAFVAKKNSIFIIDEPELSLHPKWQHEFMDAFMSLVPDGAQVLLATHSPDIVGKYKSSCVLLAGRSL